MKLRVTGSEMPWLRVKHKSIFPHKVRPSHGSVFLKDGADVCLVGWFVGWLVLESGKIVYDTMRYRRSETV